MADSTETGMCYDWLTVFVEEKERVLVGRLETGKWCDWLTVPEEEKERVLIGK